MNIFRSCILLFISLSTLTLSAQTENTQTKGKLDVEENRNDSLLNILTNIDARINDYNNKQGLGGLRNTEKSYVLQDKESILANIHVAKRDNNGLIIYPFTLTPFDYDVSFRDTVIFEPAYLPVVFDGKILPQNLDFRTEDKAEDSALPIRLINPDSTFAPQLARVQQIEHQRRYYYTRNPQRIQLNAFNFGTPVISKTVVEKRSPIKDLLSIDTETIPLLKPDVETVVIKPTFWKRNGIHKLHIMQNAVTDYWEGNQKDNYISLNSEQELNVNYKRNKISFDNRFRWNLQIQSSPADTIHKITIPKDEFEIYSVLGMESFLKNWSYAVTFQLKTPLFNSYPKNSKERQRAFLAPLDINPSIGFAYRLEKQSKHDKYKNLKLNMDVSPFSMDYTLVNNKKVDVTKHKVDAGKKSRLIVGHKLKANLEINFNRYARYKNDFEIKTDYSSVLATSRNEFSYALNRFFSLNINLDLRFDDAMAYAQKDKDLGYFQYNERLTFGLTYNW